MEMFRVGVYNRKERGAGAEEGGLHAHTTAGGPAPGLCVNASLALCMQCPSLITQV